MNTISADSYIRMGYEALIGSSFTHLVSGINEEPNHIRDELDGRCEITGYTEWISLITPTITIGWDWELKVVGRKVLYRRVDTPRSNLMIIDEERRDIGYIESAMLIGDMIDNFDWQSTAVEAINTRY